jgi:hypothetical protein
MNKKFLAKIILLVAGIFLIGTFSIKQIPKVPEFQVYNNNVAFGATNAIPTPIAFFNTSLASKITSTATSMTLVSATDKDGNTLSGTYAFIIDEGTSNEEQVNADCTGTACTNMTRGLSVVTGTTSIAALKKEHGRGASVKITDSPQLLILHRIINGISTFPNKLSYTSHPTFTSNTELIDKKYADDLAIAGSPDSSTTVKGIGRISVAPVSSTIPIFVGDNDGRVSTQAENDAQVGNNTDIAVGTGNKFVTQTGFQKGAEIYSATATGNDTYVVTLSPVPTSYVNGMHIFIKLDVANTGASTINVNSLGAISIVTGISTATATGDMLANGIYELIYNSTGTVFQLVNPASAVLLSGSYSNTVITYDLSTASGTQTIAHGLGKTPKKIKLTATQISGTPNTSTTWLLSTGSYNGTNQYCTYMSNTYNGGSAGQFATVQGNSSTQIAFISKTDGNGTNTQTGIATMDATNVTITWTKTGSPTGTLQMLLEAE